MEFIGPTAWPHSPGFVGAIRRKTGQVGLPHGASLTVFRSHGELNGEHRGKKPLKNPANTGENALEPVVGIEPTTYGLRNRCSATELHRRSARRLTEAVKYGAGAGPASGKFDSDAFLTASGAKRCRPKAIWCGCVGNGEPKAAFGFGFRWQRGSSPSEPNGKSGRCRLTMGRPDHGRAPK